jgi:hypothetical protein
MSEKQLIVALTDVCEWAKHEIAGFSWLTHVGHWRNPAVTVVFDTEKNKNDALIQGCDNALEAQIQFAGACVKAKIKQVRFESEEACKRRCNGDWERFLAMQNKH